MDNGTAHMSTPPSYRPLNPSPTPPNALDAAQADEDTPKATTPLKSTPKRSLRVSTASETPPITSTGITASLSGLIANSLRTVANALSPETAPPISQPLPRTRTSTGGNVGTSPASRKALDLPGQFPSSAGERSSRRESIQLPVSRRESAQGAVSRRVSGRDSPLPSPAASSSLLPSYFGVNFGSLLGMRPPSPPGGTISGGVIVGRSKDQDAGESHDLSLAEASAAGEVFPDTLTPMHSPSPKAQFDFRPSTPRNLGRPLSRASSMRLHDAVSTSPSRRTTLVPNKTTPRASMEGRGSDRQPSIEETKQEGREGEESESEPEPFLDPISREMTARSQAGGPPSPILAHAQQNHMRSFSVPTPPPSDLREHRNGHPPLKLDMPPRPQTARDPSSSSSTSNFPRSASDLAFRPPLVAEPAPKQKKTLLSRLGLGSAKSPSPSRSPSTMSTPPRTPSTAAPSIAATTFSEDNASLYAAEAAARPRFIKVRAKDKKQKELRHLFLAQELQIPLPPSAATMSQPDSASIVSSEDGGAPASSEAHSPPPTKSKRKKKAAIWAMAFSLDGNYLAAAGQDGIVRVWQVDGSTQPAWLNEATEVDGVTPTPRTSSFPLNTPGNGQERAPKRKTRLAEVPVFGSRPLHEFVGHTADVLDLSWSKNNFLLSSSMDKTVRLWHISRTDCLSAFLHLDCAVAVAFHPRDDRFFLSGSLDCKLRLWNVPEKRVHAWTELPELITSVAFASDGRLACAGSFVGRCTFFEIETFKYNTQFVARSGRVKKGKKVTAVRSLPGMPAGQDKILVTTNDSRIRLFNLVDRSCEAKFRGHVNNSSQIRASFSDDGRYIITGSEDRHVYVYDSGISSGGFFEGWLKGGKEKGGYEAFSVESDIATCCIFAPETTRRALARTNDLVFGQYAQGDSLQPSTSRASAVSGRSYGDGEASLPPVKGLEDAILVCADDHTGAIRVYRNSHFPQNHPSMGSRRSSQFIAANRSRAGSTISGIASEER